MSGQGAQVERLFDAEQESGTAPERARAPRAQRPRRERAATEAVEHDEFAATEETGAGRRRAPGRLRPATPGEAPSWALVELAPLVAGLRAGEIVGPVPEFMARTDGACLLYPGKVHALQGEPESGKGWITLATVASSLTAGASVLYIDFEDTPVSIVERLLALGTPHEAIVARFAYVRPCDPFTHEALTALLVTDYALAVIDGLSEAYELLGLDYESNADAVRFLAMLPQPIAERGAAVLEVDHVAKSRETRGRYAIGAQHKLAGITAAYGTEVVRVPSRTDAGLVKLMVRKDRPGHVRAHARGGVIALAHITPTDNGERVTVALEPPGDAGTVESSDRPTALMARVALYVEGNPGACRNDVIRDVTGKRKSLDGALQLLVSEGNVERRKEGNAHRHYLVRPYDQSEAQARPDRGPEPSPTTEAARPTLKEGDSAGSDVEAPTEAPSASAATLPAAVVDADGAASVEGLPAAYDPRGDFA